ncbi:hypothetical protein BAOM_4719 [Peribacillus asahii]|uniref:Peptidase S8/S53 domain-containing protein n=1 Tax=Peribacillus asahii TaxID=228899 RepID=A0A3T0KY93_9BACI|nr:S8 family serine peptidase [Peribacillus asahii]AZV45297.1 hypothetical protein BAOM_4719 [Peribacillus asahii]
MRTLLSFLLIFTLYLINGSLAAATDPSANQLIIKFNDSTSSTQKQTIFQTVHANELSTIENGNFSLISLPEGSDLNTVAATLSAFQQVELVDRNYEVTPNHTPSDPYYSKQWHLKKINMPKAWNVTFGSPDIKVAVIDAGVQTSHPDLKAHIIAPYNALTGGKSIPASAHGTHVAGIIAASMNKTGITGIAPKVKIIPINVFEGEEADIYTVVDGIDYAVQAGADIINLSLTTEDYTDVLDYAVQEAYKKGVIVVAAAGNDNTSRLQYPASHKHVIAVSATTQKDTRAAFSNFGSYIDLAAPGVDIYSTVPKGRYAKDSGTSMAAPTVSGACALILSKNPFLTPTEVENILKKSSVDLGAKGRDKYYGYGRINAYAALKQTPALPMSKLKLSSRTIAFNGTNNLPISFSAKKGTKISLYIKNSKGQVIRRLATNKAWTGGTYTRRWDGKTDSGSFAPSGQIKVTAKMSNGKHSVYRVAYVTVRNT